MLIIINHIQFFIIAHTALSFTGSFLQSCIPEVVNGCKRQSTVVTFLHDVTKKQSTSEIRFKNMWKLGKHQKAAQKC